ncbi:group II intron maturase-specific domain-containing protein [Escherichia coli]
METDRPAKPGDPGWVTHHRHVVAKETFNYVDTQIWRAIWRWCVRRHPRKGLRWIAGRYFSFEDRRWIFKAVTPEGKILTSSGQWKRR